MKEEDATTDYFCTIQTVPIPDNCLYKLTIESINEGDRFFDFGIVDQVIKFRKGTGNVAGSGSADKGKTNE